MRQATEPMEVLESASLPASESIAYPEGVKLGFIVVALAFSLILVGLVSF